MSSSRRSGWPRPCQYCSAIFTATSTDTEPESAKNTRVSEVGVISTSCRASRTAGSWVSPPNITCAIRSTWSRSARFRTGWAYPWIAAHHDDIPSTSSRPSANRSRVPLADATGSTGSGSTAEA